MKRAAFIVAFLAVSGCQNAETTRLREENQKLKAEAFAKSSIPATPLPTPIPEGTFPGDSSAFQASHQANQEAAPNHYRSQHSESNYRIAPSTLIRAIADAQDQIRRAAQESRRQDVALIQGLGRFVGGDDQPNRDAVYGAQPTPAPIATTVRGKFKIVRRAIEEAAATVQSARSPSDGDRLRSAYLAVLSLTLQNINIQEQESEQMLAAMARGERFAADVSRIRNAQAQINNAMRNANDELATYQSFHVGELTPEERAFRLK